MVLNEIKELKSIWDKLLFYWNEDNFDFEPLKNGGKEIINLEEKFVEIVIKLLNLNKHDSEVLFKTASDLRERNLGKFVYVKAGIHITNVCKENCSCCPMRKDNLNSDIIRRATSQEILDSINSAYNLGFREIFIQGGEDSQIFDDLILSLKKAKAQYPDIIFSLNLGNLSDYNYKILFDLGIQNYMIKYETSNLNLHQDLRQKPLLDRINYIVGAKKAGFDVGSGNIFGIPNQTDYDLVRDIIFLGRLGIKNYISSTPYISSEGLPEPYNNFLSPNFEKVKRYIAILRILFPGAHIHSPSNADSKKIKRDNNLISGQAELILVGADEITVEFTPSNISEFYGLYENASNRNKVNFEKAKRIAKEINLNLKYDF